VGNFASFHVNHSAEIEVKIVSKRPRGQRGEGAWGRGAKGPRGARGQGERLA